MMAANRPSRVRAPRLVRVTRLLKRVSVVVFLVFIVYLLTVAYSFGAVARGIHTNGGSGSGTAEFTGTSAISTSQLLNVSNMGIYPLTLAAGVVISDASGIVLGHGSSASTQISAGGSGQLALVALLSVSPGAPGQLLLTHSETLEYGIWANATLGIYLVVPVSVHITQNDSWGAPFSDPAATAPIAGGQASVTFSFQNNASFSVAGVLEFQLLAPGGGTCGSGSFDVSTPQGQSFDQTVAVATVCTSLVGGTLLETLSGGIGSPYIVQLPPIPIGGGP